MGGSLLFKTRVLLTLMSIVPLLVSCVAGNQATGVIKGVVTIGPLSPVERPGEKPVIPCEVYSARKIMIYDKNRTTLLKQVDIDCEGQYSVELKPGIYTVDINRIGIDRSPDVPEQIEVRTGETIELNVDIDTGIR